MAPKEKKQENENLAIYEQARQTPQSALKQIISGRLKGKSDINPIFRIKRMTEIFGPCGIGWRYEIMKQWLETYNGEVKAFTRINLYVKYNGEWSEAIPGIGGAAFVSQEKGGAYVNDECYKMSLTDALSVAMKALGVAADVYWAEDGESIDSGDSKYAYSTEGKKPIVQPQPKPQPYPELDFEAELLAESEANQCSTIAELSACYNKYAQLNPAFIREGSVFIKALSARKKSIQSQPQKTTLF